MITKNDLWKVTIMPNIIAYDLGTGGVKASLYNERLQTIARSFVEYETFYPQPDWHEQRPDDWWKGIRETTKQLLASSRIAASAIDCISLSGHSLVSVPVSRQAGCLQEYVPIWSDRRADKEAEHFFRLIDEREWYMKTGNGFPAGCYPLFKLMWLNRHHPDLFARIDKVLGSKDYINYRLTGQLATDHSYASGIGAYDLNKGQLMEEMLEAAGLSSELFPDIVPSHQIIGQVTAEASAYTGLQQGTPVACGGVDNACMALGAVGAKEGQVYMSLGSSSWIPVNSSQPVLDAQTRPYVFAHIAEGMYTSAYSIFAGGSSLRWVRDTLCMELADRADAYEQMNQWAADVPIGSNGIIFNPSLAGGSSQDRSVHIRGGYVGLHLGTTRADMIRAAMEGIAMNLRISLDQLQQHTRIENRMLICGGGSQSPLWMQIFADIFGMDTVKTNIDQDAASLGAAAIAARTAGWWNDYRMIDTLHTVENTFVPDPVCREQYRQLMPVFRHVNQIAAQLGDYMHQHSISLEMNTAGKAGKIEKTDSASYPIGSVKGVSGYEW
ncbi:xylulokinase [Paenibacillus bovis]|uniref:xylulokinase n=1 Tax=Paenibacillus bovis TaxID=1616788 RepID=UPI001D1320D5|nr:FGGY family carbohydrate kinase [Paenibacillus bovis]